MAMGRVGEFTFILEHMRIKFCTSCFASVQSVYAHHHYHRFGYHQRAGSSASTLDFNDCIITNLREREREKRKSKAETVIYLTKHFSHNTTENGNSPTYQVLVKRSDTALSDLHFINTSNHHPSTR